jgi:hypothetical protein
MGRWGRGSGTRYPGARGGYIDNSIVFWIVLILAAIAVPRVLEATTGLTVGALWDAIPELRRSMIVRSFALAAGVLVLTFLSAISGSPVGRARRNEAGSVAIPLLLPGRRTFGVGLVVMTSYLVRGGLADSGWVGGATIGLGLLIGLVSIPVLASSDWFVVDPTQVSKEARFLGRVTGSETYSVDQAAEEPVSTVTTQTGGAFGQPLTITYSVRTSGGEIYSGTHESHAQDVQAALQKAIQTLGAPSSEGGEASDPAGPKGAT